MKKTKAPDSLFIKSNNLAYDMDGYELFAGDYVACGKKVYQIVKIIDRISKQGIVIHADVALELMHVKTTKIVKRKDFEVERLD